ncbi:protein-disulfide reductase DsbD domain-containing protein [Streptomyces polyrhachis]|uniref:Protein-disulfide reductase DsbD domain-containing protein n=1 Tax=Streptomyces polyrhachis TaxID=1282885 RepID=A0ABW2GKN1_9ACTN
MRRGSLRAVRTAAVLLATAGAAAGCGEQAPVSEQFTDGGVAVTVTATDGQVVARLRPERAGFHLYSLSLPDAGVDGLGIPTRLSVSGALTATGAPRTDAEERTVRPEGLDVALPVYADGPVTVVLPVKRTGDGEARIVLTYGACSERGGCLPPVRERAVAVELG